MAERFKNIYITAREFINNWEKEMYELTQLDYFIYLLINDLGASIEQDFMPGRSIDDVLLLDNREIASLAFAIGDGLNTFLEKNCFGACSLGCPNKLAKPFSPKDEEVRAAISVREFAGKTDHCTSREECLFHDVMSYVVVDVLIDFYNYELVVEIDDNDPKLNTLSLFIMESILKFTEKNGPLILRKPEDPAIDDFNEILLEDAGNWDEDVLDELLDEDDDESWKYGNLAVTSIIEIFQQDRPDCFTTKLTSNVLASFNEYVENYLGGIYVDSLEFEELKTFFLIEMPLAFILQDDFSWRDANRVFQHIFEYIDAETGNQLADRFALFQQLEMPESYRTFAATQMAHKRITLLDFMLTQNNEGSPSVEGYYEVADVDSDGYTFYDIHLKSLYKGIRLEEADSVGIKLGDIIHGHISIEENHGRLKYVEMVYPPVCKYLLY